MVIKFLYTIFLGILVALFIGLGIAAFYVAPKAPDYPALLQEPTPVSIDGKTNETAEQKSTRLEFDRAQKQYQTDAATYNRRVSIIALIGAIISLVAALGLVVQVQLISDGLLLGGVLTLLYSIVRGLMGENNLYRFVITAVGLGVALIIGYLKFIKPEPRTQGRPLKKIA